MTAASQVFLTRSAKAFSSFAVTVALAVLTILVLVFGSMRDSNAEAISGTLLRQVNVEEPTVDLDAAARSLPQRLPADAVPAVISRQPLRSARSAAATRLAGTAPTKDWMGMSQMAFPLLVGDLTVARPMVAPTVMTGRTVGTK